MRRHEKDAGPLEKTGVSWQGLGKMETAAVVVVSDWGYRAVKVSETRQIDGLLPPLN